MWMLTSTGKHFDLRNPRAEDIEISDICQSLSRICRFLGHCDNFYSVADHILNGRKYVEPHLVKYWDFHDAEEAFIGDIPTPLKKLLGPEFKKIQEGVHKAICDRFDLPLDFDQQVKRNDLRMLLAEREVLFSKRHLIEPWGIDYHMQETGDFIDYEHVEVIVRPMGKSESLLYEILEKYA